MLLKTLSLNPNTQLHFGLDTKKKTVENFNTLWLQKKKGGLSAFSSKIKGHLFYFFENLGQDVP